MGTLRAGCLGLSAPSSLSLIGSAYITTPQSALTGKPSDCSVGGVSQTISTKHSHLQKCLQHRRRGERMPIPAHWLLSPKRNSYPGQVVASIPTLPMSRHSFRVAAAFFPTPVLPRRACFTHSHSSWRLKPSDGLHRGRPDYRVRRVLPHGALSLVALVACASALTSCIF